MSRVQHTRAEREAINRAWDILYDFIDVGWTAADKLRRALAYERKERSSITATKALLVQSFMDGYTQADQPNKWPLSDGMNTLAFLGAYTQLEHRERVPERWYGIAHAAIAAHDAALARAFDEEAKS